MSWYQQGYLKTLNVFHKHTKFANHAAAHLITQYGARLKTLQAYAELKSAYA